MPTGVDEHWDKKARRGSPFDSLCAYTHVNGWCSFPADAHWLLMVSSVSCGHGPSCTQDKSSGVIMAAPLLE